MFEWFSYCTFDIVGDLSFGESSGCLGVSIMRSWLGIIFANVKLVSQPHSLQSDSFRLPLLATF